MSDKTSSKRITRLAAISFIGIIALFAILQFQSQVSEDRSEIYGDQYEKAENAGQRLRYEWMRQRDPATGKIPANIRREELSYARTLPRLEERLPQKLRKGAADAWTSRGPVNQGGRTRALAIDLDNENIVLAGGISGGMWRSTDGGDSWTRTTSLSDSSQSVTCVAQDPRAGQRNVWYYGTGERVGNSANGVGSSYLGNGIYKSTDNGSTWNLLPATSTYTPQNVDVQDFVWNIAISPVDGSVYAAYLGYLLKSSDGGQTWAIARGSSAPFSNYVDVAITSTGVVYAALSSEGAQKGIHRSTDGGATWTTITPSTWPSVYARTLLAIAPSDESIMYVIAETPGSGFQNAETDDTYWTSFYKYAYVSGDGSGSGGTWVNRSANLPAYGGNVGNFTHQHSYDLLVKVKPDDANAVFIGGTNLYRSTNGFADASATTWIGGYSTANDISQYAEHHPDQHALVFYPSNPSMALSGHDGGVSGTLDILATPVVWQLGNTGYVTSQFYSVAIDMATPGDPVIIGGLQDNGNLFTNSADGTVGWKPLPFGGDGTIAAIADNKSSYYIGTQNGDVTRLILDAAGTTQDYATVKPAGATGFEFVTPYILDPTNRNRMYLAAGDRVWRNSDLTGIPTATQDQAAADAPTSVNWSEMTNTAVANEVVSALEATTLPADRLYYGTSEGRVFKVAGASSGDPAPTEITGTGFPAGAFVTSISSNPRNGDSTIVVFSNYNVKSLFFTPDGGSTWTDISGNLEENPDGSGRGPSCRWAAVLPTPEGMKVYVATSIGVYSTEAVNGTSTVWSQEGADKMGNVVVNMILVRPSDNLVVAGTHANGVYSSTAVVTGVYDEPLQTPTVYGLSQNYPNPFNPTTTIEYTIPKAGDVQIFITDLTGRRIATLVDGANSAGRHRAIWNGHGDNGQPAASGIYFYRLEGPGVRDSRKMTLLK